MLQAGFQTCPSHPRSNPHLSPHPLPVVSFPHAGTFSFPGQQLPIQAAKLDSSYASRYVSSYFFLLPACGSSSDWPGHSELVRACAGQARRLEEQQLVLGGTFPLLLLMALLSLTSNIRQPGRGTGLLRQWLQHSHFPSAPGAGGEPGGLGKR